MNTSVRQIAELVGGRVIGDSTVKITGLNGIRQATPGDLTFVADDRYRPFIEETKAAAVLVPRDIERCGKPLPLIQVANPYAAFATVLQSFRPPTMHHPEGVHPTAVIGKDAVLGRGVGVDAHVVIADGAEIGDGVVLYAGTYVGRNSRIGAKTLVYANVSIREDVLIGEDCIIHPGAVIGSDGFGFTSDASGHKKIPQCGRVVIGDNVEIGANSAIDRATFGKTVIGSGTKIDNLVQIGHNAQIGEHCLISGNAGIAGSAILGDFVTVAAGAGVTGHVEVGDHVTIGALAGVTKSIPPGKTVSGFPATDHNTERRLKAGIRRVPDALRQLRDLEQRLEALEKGLDGKTEDNS